MLRILLAILSAFSLAVGVLLATGSWRDQRDFQKIRERGYHAMARIARAYPDTPRSGQPPSYLVELQWTDSVGREHIYGPTHISAQFWRQITTNSILTTRQTEIAALPENVSARPVIISDIEERKFQDEFGLKFGVAFLLFGSALGSFLIFHLFKNRRARARSVDAVYDAQQQMNKWRHAMGALLANEANAVFVREMIYRLEESGLRIAPTLNRELVTIRVLRHCAYWCENGDLIQFFTDKNDLVAGNSFDLLMLLELARESDGFDSFYGYSGLETALPDFSTLSEGELASILSVHSTSIFENAASIGIVNEHAPGEFLKEKLGQLEALADGDFAVQSLVEAETPGFLIEDITLDDGESARFEIIDGKRTDLTPLFETLNALITQRNKGRFTTIIGDSEDVIAIYLRPSEQPAFRQWAERQHYSSGLSLLDCMQ
ncbi:MAG: hypothetical protein WA156_14390 [Methylocystis silviterrae]